MVSSAYPIIPKEVVKSRLTAGFEMGKTYVQVHPFQLLWNPGQVTELLWVTAPIFIKSG